MSSWLNNVSGWGSPTTVPLPFPKSTKDFFDPRSTSPSDPITKTEKKKKIEEISEGGSNKEGGEIGGRSKREGEIREGEIQEGEEIYKKEIDEGDEEIAEEVEEEEEEEEEERGEGGGGGGGDNKKNTVSSPKKSNSSSSLFSLLQPGRKESSQKSEKKDQNMIPNPPSTESSILSQTQVSAQIQTSPPSPPPILPSPPPPTATSTTSTTTSTLTSTSPPSTTTTVFPPPLSIPTSLTELITKTQSSYFQPMEFFVAWQGVLTIAYSGIPPPIEQLKREMESEFPFLVSENPGSKWPKTTLACLRDDKRLSLGQLETLREICSDESFQLVVSGPVLCDKLSVVTYESCCLEKVLLNTELKLRDPPSSDLPSSSQQSNTRQVLDAFAARNLAEYWFHASKDGNRTLHYRRSKLGVTLVHFLNREILSEALDSFQQLVEEALPGMYDWFSRTSLHITVRALT